jgi:uncharacterized membrane protein YdbT with pleckstrin-like domain
MTHANIQNLAIQQGPVQRLFGISDLRVRTAGGGHRSGGAEQEASEGAIMHLGYLRGVDNPVEIRDLILNRMRRHRDSGLGDPDEQAAGVAPAHHAAESAPDDLVAAARELLAEARRLRSALE